MKMFFFSVCASLIALCIAAELPPTDPASPCTRRNVFMKVDGKCDSYIECTDHVPVNKTCPEGLHYNANVSWPNYPCGYPADVPCKERSVPQKAKPTKDCPHQFGYFPTPDAQPSDCGQYRMCIAGKAVDMVCPTGLAFNFDSGRCDWPNLVKSCDVAAFLGYECPPASFDESGNPVISKHKFDGNCFAFYSCQDGIGRLLSCDPGLAFDSVTGHCIDADNVPCESEQSEKAETR